MDLERVTVVLVDADAVDRLEVRVGEPATASDRSEPDVHRLQDVLASAHVGRLLDAGRALVRPDAVRFHAAGQVGERWSTQFDELSRRRAAGPDGIDDGVSMVAPVRWPDGPEADSPIAATTPTAAPPPPTP